MTERPKGGFLVFNKPEGMISNQALSRIKRLFKVRKAGYIGTLDPFATGVLPIAIHQGTRLIPYFENDIKGYEGEITLGVETNTMDSSGEITAERTPPSLDAGEIEKVFREFVGMIEQVPPMFSARKVKGVPLYKMARKGKEIERETKRVVIHEFVLRGVEGPRLKFSVSCSKGTYIRVLAHDVGRRLGCGAVLSQLCRVRSGRFRLEDAVTLEELEAMEMNERWAKVLSNRAVLASWEEIIVPDEVVRAVVNGRAITWMDVKRYDLPLIKTKEPIKIVSRKGDLAAIVKSRLAGEGEKERENRDLSPVIYELEKVFAP
jgi:tRNA pseudouridine55 synthase